jgi:anaerobic selenocysteine-containing dehydrogenase
VTKTVVQSFCRACINSCPVMVEVVDGRLDRVRGDPSNDIWAGYSCIKGQTQPAFYRHPDRLLHPLRRRSDGNYERIDLETATGEIAERLGRIVADHGPRAFAYYGATGISQQCLAEPFFGAFLRSLGSSMRFSPNTIDKPGKSLALALHGAWMAPLQGYHDPDVALLVGANPLKSYYGVPSGHPGRWIREHLAQGKELLVIDPRRSDVAKRATLHLQPHPGHDPAILACLIHVILAEELTDETFLHENASGLEELRAAVAPFRPELVGERAQVAPGGLRELARRFAGARRGYIACGVGPGFAKSSTLVEYLALLLETLCGHWLRAGERVERTTTLLSSGPFRAQARGPSPAWGFGEVMRVGGLTQTTAGLPTGALAEEILLDGEGQVRALFSAGGNPVISWPDQQRTLQALRSLELLVQFDPWMSATAREAHYVIPPSMAYETPGMTTVTDFVIAMPTYYGPDRAWAQYSEAVVAPPEGSELIPEWEFVYGLARRMGLPLSIEPMSLSPTLGEAGYPVDMENKPTAYELMEILAGGGRVSLAEVKKHPGGSTYPDPAVVVLDKEPGWTGRFDLANQDMLRDLAGELAEEQASPVSARPFRLIAVRIQNQFNTTLNDPLTDRGRPYNPAFLHPSDLQRLGLSPGDEVEISSDRSTVRAVLDEDPDLLPGVIAMAWGFGGAPERDGEFRRIGSPPGRLLDAAAIADPYVGMPRIGNVPVSVTAWTAASEVR